MTIYPCRLSAVQSDGGAAVAEAAVEEEKEKRARRPKIIKSKLRNNVSLVAHEYSMFSHFGAARTLPLART